MREQGVDGLANNAGHTGPPMVRSDARAPCCLARWGAGCGPHGDDMGGNVPGSGARPIMAGGLVARSACWRETVSRDGGIGARGIGRSGVCVVPALRLGWAL